MPATILAVDDQGSFRFLLQQQLSNAGFAPLMAGSAEEALAILEKQPVDLILSDLVMPETDGLAFLAQARERFSSVPFILLTAHGTVATAVEALKLGAFDYLEKDCPPDELQITIQRALTYHSLARENEQFKEHFQQQYSFQNIVTVSPQMGEVLKIAAGVVNAPRTTVAIFGESGCGKEVLARAIHFAGGGMPAGFVGVNCAAIPEALLESELFGHRRGSYTGAEYDREGKFSQAKGGTILLDEIGDMPLGLQAKLLRVLEERAFEAIGSDRPIAVECRIVITTHHDLLRLVEEGCFRKDLYHRVNVFPIVIPPLRERLADIPILVDYFMKLNRNDLGKSLPGVSEKGMDKLLAYQWPGNVRELRNCLERAAILVPVGELIRPEQLSTAAPGASPQTPPQLQPAPGEFDYALSFTSAEISLETVTNRILDITLERCEGNKSKAASILKVNRKMFYR
ncbi:MAG: sigma-54-dependent transcriptional regulator [Syntrophales bacterium]